MKLRRAGAVLFGLIGASSILWMVPESAGANPGVPYTPAFGDLTVTMEPSGDAARVSGDGFAADSTVLLTLLRNDSGEIAHEADLNSDDDGAMEAIIQFEPLDPGPHTANAIGPAPDGATVQLSGAVVVSDDTQVAAPTPAPAPAPAPASQAEVSPVEGGGAESAEVAEATTQDPASDDADAGSSGDPVADAATTTDPTQAASSEADASASENELSTDAASSDSDPVDPAIVATAPLVDDGASTGIWVGALLAAVLAAIAASVVHRRRNRAPLGVHHTNTDT